jgi:hypothetical protein
VFAGNTLERDPPVHRLGCVRSHSIIVTAYSGGTSGHWVCNLRVGQRGGESYKAIFTVSKIPR